MGKFAVMFVVALMLAPRPASADGFSPIGGFQYNLPNGTPVIGASSGDVSSAADVAAAQAQGLVDQAIYSNAIDGIEGVNYVNGRYFMGVSTNEGNLQTDQRFSDLKNATLNANNLNTLWQTLQNARDLQRIHAYLAFGNESALDNAFQTYATKVGQTVQSAQAIPQQISSFINSYSSDLQLLEAAWQFQGTQYAQMTKTTHGFECNDLVTDSLANMGFSTPLYPLCKGCTVTEGWFRYGMGRASTQIYGGDNGIPLRQLVADYTADKINIPPGALIVSNGHVALFVGVAKVGATQEIITYDANASAGWVVSAISGEATQGPTVANNNLGMADITFGAHTVSMHVTDLQWKTKKSDPPVLVKVYRFIGNPAIPVQDPSATFSPPPQAITTQCDQTDAMDLQAEKAACTTAPNSTGCKTATARVQQNIAGCPVPAVPTTLLPH
jgi:hypothetical protein